MYIYNTISNHKKTLARHKANTVQYVTPVGVVMFIIQFFLYKGRTE